MASQSKEHTSISPYRRNSSPGPPTPGERVRCELCEDTKRCFDKYGLITCQDCHHDLLPARGLL